MAKGEKITLEKIAVLITEMHENLMVVSATGFQVMHRRFDVLTMKIK